MADSCICCKKPYPPGFRNKPGRFYSRNCPYKRRIRKTAAQFFQCSNRNRIARNNNRMRIPARDDFFHTAAGIFNYLRLCLFSVRKMFCITDVNATGRRIFFLQICKIRKSASAGIKKRKIDHTKHNNHLTEQPQYFNIYLCSL